MEKLFHHSFRLYNRHFLDAWVRQAKVDGGNAKIGRYGSDSSNTSLIGAQVVDQMRYQGLTVIVQHH
jgi:hypothetical protein